MDQEDKEIYVRMEKLLSEDGAWSKAFKSRDNMKVCLTWILTRMKKIEFIMHEVHRDLRDLKAGVESGKRH